jgi:hypothetical protein
MNNRQYWTVKKESRTRKEERKTEEGEDGDK